MTADTIDLRRHSVTRSDAEYGGVAVLRIYDAAAWDTSVVARYATPGLPAYWSQRRDIVLAATPRIEGMWASALFKAISKQAALGFRIEDEEDSGRRTKNAQGLLLAADATGWVPFLSRHLQDYLTTDNGAVVEIVRASSARGSRILGLMHLDSLACTRTGDPASPIVYRDRNGKEHEMKEHQVLLFSDMTSPRQSLNGVGFCAAGRAFDTIVKLAAVQTYFREKVTGDRVLAIHIVSGLNKAQMEQALQSAADEQIRKGNVVYKGSVVIPTLDPTLAPAVVTIPLAEIPDGFDVEQERRDAYLRYANAIGVPVQDIQPLSGQGLGTGTQTVVLDEAAEGQGLAAWRKAWEQAISHRVLPAFTKFAFATNDIRDKKALAEVANIRAGERKTRIESGEITPQEARQIALDAGDLPKEMSDRDLTPGGTLDDTEKPATGEEAIRPPVTVPVPVVGVPQ